MEGLIAAGDLATKETTPGVSMAAYESFMFLMAITVAHELCHLYVGLFTGYDRPQTPEDVSFLPELFNQSFEGDIIGESGRAWEGMVLGGIVECFADLKHPLKAHQPGIMYLIDQQKVTRRVPNSYIHEYLKSLGAHSSELPNSEHSNPSRLLYY